MYTITAMTAQTWQIPASTSCLAAKCSRPALRLRQGITFGQGRADWPEIWRQIRRIQLAAPEVAVHLRHAAGTWTVA